MTLDNPTTRAVLCGAGLLAASLAAVLLSVAEGAHATDLGAALSHIWSDDGSNVAFAVRALRLPRALCAVGVGAALALSGALIQIVIRNPLGDPGLTGVTAGAAFGVALTLTLLSASPSLLVGAGVAGGALAAFLTYSLARSPAGLEPLRVILAGIAVTVFFLAATSAVMVVSRSSMQTLYFWMVGGFINRGWAEFHLFWPVASAAAVAVFAMSPILKLLQFDDTMAAGMGVSSQRWRIAAGALSVILAAASVAVAGPLAFVGFVAPHLARLCLGKDAAPGMLTWLITTMLMGAALVVWADAATRVIFAGRVPAGALITILGGLAFLTLARRGVRHAV
ncbi:MAG: iron ABC transporter permease [Pseudomonadota bacterium]